MNTASRSSPRRRAAAARAAAQSSSAPPRRRRHLRRTNGGSGHPAAGGDRRRIDGPESRIEKYKAFLAATVSSLRRCLPARIVVHVIAEDVALVVARQVLQEMAAALLLTPEVLKDVGTFALERIGHKVTSLGEQAALKQHLAAVYEKEEGGRSRRKCSPASRSIRASASSRTTTRSRVHQDRDALPAGRGVHLRRAYINRASLLSARPRRTT